MGWKRSPGLESLKAPKCFCLFLQAPAMSPVSTQINFLLNRPRLLVYTRAGTHCLNLGFVSSAYIKPNHFCLCLLHMDQVVLVGSGDARTLPANMERGEEHYEGEKWSHRNKMARYSGDLH